MKIIVLEGFPINEVRLQKTVASAAIHRVQANAIDCQTIITNI